LGQTCGADLPADETLPELRARLARYVLCTELVASLHDPLPPQLETVRTAPAGPARAVCVRLARTWRVRRDLAESYARYADRTEQELGLTSVGFDLAQIRDCETFAAIERALQSAIEAAMLAGALDEPLAIAQRRQAGYWAAELAEVQARWALIVAAGSLLRAAAQVEADLRPARLSAIDILRADREGASPWCLFDTLHRDLE
jgi:hypothetical protein